MFKKHNVVKILIADEFPSMNKGELAILQGMLQTFKVLNRQTKVTVFSFHPNLDKTRYPEDIYLINIPKNLHLIENVSERKDITVINGLISIVQHFLFYLIYFAFGRISLKLFKGSLWRAYLECDVIITCHDQESVLIGPKTLPFLPLYLTFLTRSLKKLLVIYGNGTNKFKRKIWEKLAAYVLKNVNLVTVRERVTLSYLKNIVGQNSNIFLTGDPAFLLPPASFESVREIMKNENLKRRQNDNLLVGITLPQSILTSFLSTFNHINKEEAIQLYAKLLDSIVERHKAVIAFLPHCIGDNIYKDDRILAKEIFARCKNKHKIVVINSEYSADELKGLIGVCDIVIGGRVHSIIGAVSMCTPSITIARPNDSRVSGILGEMMNQREWIYDCYDKDLKGLYLKIDKLISLRREISKKLEYQSQIVRELALANGRLFGEVLSRQCQTKEQ